MDNKSLITNSVWVEMHRVKGYLKQIEIYTDRKRHSNRVLNLIIICSSILCAIASFFHNIPYIPWISIVFAMVVAVLTCVKELMPQFIQPERELCELDNIYNFYNLFLHDLEHLFLQRFDEKTEIDDKMMNERLHQLLRTEGDRVTRINVLCRKIKEGEKCRIEDETKLYFKTKYNNYER